jgi:hypothetical protein
MAGVDSPDWLGPLHGELCLNPSFQGHASTGSGAASSGQRHRGNMRDFTVAEREEMRREVWVRWEM